MKYILPTNIEFDTKKFQDRLKATRLARDYSYRELADRTGISKSTLYKLETDCTDMLPVVHTMSLAKALNVDLLWLIGIDAKSKL